MSDISTSPSSSKKFTSNTPSWKEMCYSISAFSKLPTFSFRRTPTSLHWWIDCWRKKMLILNKFTPHPKIHGLWPVSESNSPRPANIILGIFQLKLTHLKNLDLELAEAWITLFQSVGKIDPSLSAGEPTSVCHWGHLHFPSALLWWVIIMPSLVQWIPRFTFVQQISTFMLVQRISTFTLI